MHKLSNLFAIASLLSTSTAFSCPSNHYEDCRIICLCLPNSGAVIENAPATIVVRSITDIVSSPYVAPVFATIRDATADLVEKLKTMGASASVGAMATVAGASDVARNTVEESKRFGAELQVAGSTIVEFAKAQASGYSEVYKSTLQSAREGRVVDALWQQAVGPLQTTERNAGDAALRSEYLRAVGQVAASSAYGPGGSAAYAAWLTYRQTGDPQLSLRTAIIVAASGFAMQGVGEIDSTTKKAILTGAISGVTIAAAGGNEDAIRQGFFKGATMVIVQDGYKEFTGEDLSGKPSKGLPFCMRVGQPNCERPPDGAIQDIDSDGNITYDPSFRPPASTPTVGFKDPKSYFNESNPVMVSASRIPGVQAMSIFHDKWVDSWHMGTISNPATIVPAIVITYTGLGVPLLEDIRSTAIDYELSKLAEDEASKKVSGQKAAPQSVVAGVRPEAPFTSIRPDWAEERHFPIDAVICRSKKGEDTGVSLYRRLGSPWCSDGKMRNSQVKIGGTVNPKSLEVERCVRMRHGSPVLEEKRVGDAMCAVFKRDHEPAYQMTVSEELKRRIAASKQWVTRPNAVTASTGKWSAAVPAGLRSSTVTTSDSLAECVATFRAHLPKTLPPDTVCMRATDPRQQMFVD